QERPPDESGELLRKNEELKDTDEKDTKLINSPRKVYKVNLEKGRTYQIDLKSTDFDAVLRLVDFKGQEVAYNNNLEPGSPDSRITYSTVRAGEYKIIATTLNKKIGKFILTVVDKGKTIDQTGKKKDEKIIATKSGLKYVELKVGTGKEAKAGDTVLV